jgi:hypothetical protein
VRSGTDEIYLLFLVIATFIFFCFFCTAQIGIRYILPAMPFIYVLSGQVAAWKPEKRHRLGKTCFIILLLWLPVSFFSFFPHYISYFNEFCPDRLRLYKYLADSNLDWGQNVHYLRRYINAHQKGKIIVNPSSPATGTIIVNVNSLVGVTTSPSRYAWLRNNYSPVEHVGYSWLIYEIPE